MYVVEKNMVILLKITLHDNNILALWPIFLPWGPCDTQSVHTFKFFKNKLSLVAMSIRL